MRERAPDVGPVLAQLDDVRVRARDLAGRVEQVVGGSATGVDRELVGALLAVERSLRAAVDALGELARRS